MNLIVLSHQIRMQSLDLGRYREKICSSRLTQLQRKQPMDQLRSLTGDLLVCSAMKQWGISQKEPLQYDRDKYGKPFLSAHSGFHFNVSHSGDWVVCVAAKHPIGIDIQQERPVRDALLRHVLSDQEFHTLNTQEPEERQSAFFDLWCLKEAYCKATGLGLRMPMRTIEILMPQVKLNNCNDSIRLLSPVEPGYHTGLCCQHPLPEHIPISSVTELLAE